MPPRCPRGVLMRVTSCASSRWRCVYALAAVLGSFAIVHLVSKSRMEEEGGGGGGGGEERMVGFDGGWSRPKTKGWLAKKSKFFDTRGNGDPSGLLFAPGAAERRERQLSLFKQKLEWRVANPIENVTFGFMYYLGAPTPGAVEQQYIRELALSIQALGCSSFEEKNVVVATDTEESRDQLQSALQGVGEGTVSIRFQVVTIPRELTDDPDDSSAKPFLEAVERCRRLDVRAKQHGDGDALLCYRVQMTMKVFSLAQSPFDATLSVDPDVFINFLLLRRDAPETFSMKRFRRILHSADWVGVNVLCFMASGCPLGIRGHNGGWLFYLLHPATRAFIYDLAMYRMIHQFPKGHDQSHLENEMLSGSHPAVNFQTMPRGWMCRAATTTAMEGDMAWTMYGRKSVGKLRKNPSGTSPGFESNLEVAGYPEACVFWHSHTVVKPVEDLLQHGCPRAGVAGQGHGGGEVAPGNTPGKGRLWEPGQVEEEDHHSHTEQQRQQLKQREKADAAGTAGEEQERTKKTIKTMETEEDSSSDVVVPLGAAACAVAEKNDKKNVSSIELDAVPASVRRGEHYYVFTHIPKTAGSAVLQFMKARMGCGNVACQKCSEAVTSSGCIAHKTSAVSAGGGYASIQITFAEPAWRCACEGCCRVINTCGHKGHRRRTQLVPAVEAAAQMSSSSSSSSSFAASTSPEVRLFAMFREPVARTLSNYRHAKRTNQAKYACCGLPVQLYREVNQRSGGRMDLEGFLSHPAVRNMATKMLAGLNPGDTRVDWEAERRGGGEGIPPNKTLNAALAALEEIDFVGLQEEYGESLRQLAVWMGLDRVPTAEDEAVLNSHGNAAQLKSMENGKKIREMAREANVEDEIVYNRAREMFEAQKRRWPTGFVPAVRSQR